MPLNDTEYFQKSSETQISCYVHKIHNSGSISLEVCTEYKTTGQL